MLMSRINCLTSRGVLGRPPRLATSAIRQYKRKPARCQRITVSGLTIAKALSTPGAKPYSPANTRRSILLAEFGFFGDLRRRILSWWRSARISISSEARDRNNPISPHQISLQSSIIEREASPDLLLFASRIKFATGTVVSAWSECDLGTNFDDAAGRNFEVVTRIVGYARKRDEQPILPARHARAGGRLERPAGQEERS